MLFKSAIRQKQEGDRLQTPRRYSGKVFEAPSPSPQSRIRRQPKLQRPVDGKLSRLLGRLPNVKDASKLPTTPTPTPTPHMANSSPDTRLVRGKTRVRPLMRSDSPTNPEGNLPTSVSALAAMSRRACRPGRLLGINGSRGTEVRHQSGNHFYAALAPHIDAAEQQVVEDEAPVNVQLEKENLVQEEGAEDENQEEEGEEEEIVEDHPAWESHLYKEEDGGLEPSQDDPGRRSKSLFVVAIPSSNSEDVWTALVSRYDLSEFPSDARETVRRLPASGVEYVHPQIPQKTSRYLIGDETIATREPATATSTDEPWGCNSVACAAASTRPPPVIGMSSVDSNDLPMKEQVVTNAKTEDLGVAAQETHRTNTEMRSGTDDEDDKVRSDMGAMMGRVQNKKKSVRSSPAMSGMRKSMSRQSRVALSKRRTRRSLHRERTDVLNDNGAQVPDSDHNPPMDADNEAFVRNVSPLDAQLEAFLRNVSPEADIDFYTSERSNTVSDGSPKRRVSWSSEMDLNIDSSASHAMGDDSMTSRLAGLDSEEGLSRSSSQPKRFQGNGFFAARLLERRRSSTDSRASNAVERRTVSLDGQGRDSDCSSGRLDVQGDIDSVGRTDTMDSGMVCGRTETMETLLTADFAHEDYRDEALAGEDRIRSWVNGGWKNLRTTVSALEAPVKKKSRVKKRACADLFWNALETARLAEMGTYAHLAEGDIDKEERQRRLRSLNSAFVRSPSNDTRSNTLRKSKAQGACESALVRCERDWAIARNTVPLLQQMDSWSRPVSARPKNFVASSSTTSHVLSPTPKQLLNSLNTGAVLHSFELGSQSDAESCRQRGLRGSPARAEGVWGRIAAKPHSPVDPDAVAKEILDGIQQTWPGIIYGDMSSADLISASGAPLVIRACRRPSVKQCNTIVVDTACGEQAFCGKVPFSDSWNDALLEKIKIALELSPSGPLSVLDRSGRDLELIWNDHDGTPELRIEPEPEQFPLQLKVVEHVLAESLPQDAFDAQATRALPGYERVWSDGELIYDPVTRLPTASEMVFEGQAASRIEPRSPTTVDTSQLAEDLRRASILLEPGFHCESQGNSEASADDCKSDEESNDSAEETLPC